MRAYAHTHVPLRRLAMSAEWVSARAVAWVIHDAPVPADLAWTLTVIAARCDENGRGSRQSTATIAALTGKSPKQAQRDIVRLRDLGLLLLGDQSLVEHLPAGQRPVVYDVPMHLSGPKPVRESKNKAGVKKPTDGPTPPMDGSGPIHGGSTPPMDVPPPLPSMGAKQSLNNPLNNSLSGAGRIVAEALAHLGVTEEETREVIKAVQKAEKTKIEKPIPYFRAVAQRGDLPDYLTDVRAAAERRTAHAARQTQLAQLDTEVPRPRGDQPPPDPDAEIAAVRARLLKLNPAAARRTFSAPTRATRLAEPDPGVEADRAYLASLGNFDVWWSLACQDLPEGTRRDDITRLAAKLARTSPTPAAGAAS